MPLIKALTTKVINQIAAGEVVERPASVVKELLENALDAKAGFIEIEIQDGGLKLIRVADNGEGMAAEDARLSIQKHTTSKIDKVDDLQNLHSFGFRGEALSSIASVSHFELTTRPASSLSGLSLKIRGGSAPQEVEVGRPLGTTLTVSNLFFNTPARLKFMKKKSTEENHILMVATTYALAFPQVGFKLTMDGRSSLDVSASSFETRVSQIFGKDLFKNLIPIQWQNQTLKIKGMISVPSVNKTTRENMIYFVNNRWVGNPSLGYAVMTAYRTLLPTRRFPVALLFVEAPLGEVDVNVHPTKREVKFAKDREVFDAVVQAVRQGLLSTMRGTPAAEAPGAPGALTSSFGSPEQAPTAPAESSFYAPLTQETKAPGLGLDHFKQLRALSENHSSYPSASEKIDLQVKRIDPQTPLYNFSQLFNTFIVFQSDDEMFIADQHTVHERLNYERLMKGFQDRNLEVQPLLMPQTIELNPREAQTLRNHLEVLMELGLEVSPFGGNTFLIRSVPADFSGKNVSQLLKDLIDQIAEDEKNGTTGPNRIQQIRERTLTFFSCRSAVMAGDRLTQEQMIGLVDQMRKENLPFTCPHGRPTLMTIPLSELYRKFDRH
jgi:DNA mismatch repair protein MutL